MEAWPDGRDAGTKSTGLMEMQWRRGRTAGTPEQIDRSDGDAVEAWPDGRDAGTKSTGLRCRCVPVSSRAWSWCRSCSWRTAVIIARTTESRPRRPGRRAAGVGPAGGRYRLRPPFHRAVPARLRTPRSTTGPVAVQSCGPPWAPRRRRHPRLSPWPEAVARGVRTTAAGFTVDSPSAARAASACSRARAPDGLHQPGGGCPCRTSTRR